MAEVVRLATVQKRGQVTLPIEMRRNLGIEEGGVVAVIETQHGILISPREVLTVDAMNRIGAALKERGLSLDELIDSGREIRSRIVDEEYGLQPGNER